MQPLTTPAEIRPVTRIDREFDLPNRTIQLLIQWIRQNNGRLPNRRRNAPELQLLQPGQLERIEAIVTDCFADGPRHISRP